MTKETDVSVVDTEANEVEKTIQSNDSDVVISTVTTPAVMSVDKEITDDVHPLIKAVAEGQMSVADMKEMMQLQRDYEANEARKAFIHAMAKAKENPPKIVNDLVNQQYGEYATYSSLGNIVEVGGKHFSQFGFFIRWAFEEPADVNKIICDCIITHERGHSETVRSIGPLDDSGKKNPLQQRRSTKTYLKIDTFLAVTGLSSLRFDTDDDANGAFEEKLITDSQRAELILLLPETEGATDIFEKWLNDVYKIECVEELPAEAFIRVLTALKKKKRAREAFVADLADEESINENS